MNSPIRIQRKPLSINEAYTGRRFKTDAYKSFTRDMLNLLPKKVDLPEPPYHIIFTFGLSSANADWDNSVKTCQDLIATKYKFNDKLIHKGTVEKILVPKGKEFAEFQILHHNHLPK